MIDFYKKLIESENCKVNFIFSNDPKTILDYVKDVFNRYKIKKMLSNAGAKTIYGLYEIINKSINGSGYNSKYGLLGYNKSAEERLKVFSITGEKIVADIGDKGTPVVFIQGYFDNISND